MRRYDLEETGQPYESDRQMVEDPNGEWVKWEDVECVCEEMYCQRTYWFCPSHGYKRK